MYRDVSVWTGQTTFDAIGMTETCDDWTDPDGSYLGRTGRSTRSLNESFGGVTISGCGAFIPIYCVTYCRRASIYMQRATASMYRASRRVPDAPQ